MWHNVIRPFIACVFLLMLTGQAVVARDVWLAVTEETGGYAEVRDVLRAGLSGAAEVRTDVPVRLFDKAKGPPALIVTVGVGALDATLERLAGKDGAWASVPLLATLLPQAVFDARQAAPSAVKRPFSAVVLDQPLGRQMAAVRLAFPDHKRIGVMLGPQTQPLLPALQRQAERAGLVLHTSPPVNTAEDVYPALKRLLIEAHLILVALPDPLIYNANNLQSILLTTYRARVPLVAFSSAYVKAGAVLAVYSTPKQIAQRTLEMSHDVLSGRGLPPPQAARAFSVAINAKVVASFGLSLDDEVQIAEDLRRQEAGL